MSRLLQKLALSVAVAAAAAVVLWYALPRAPQRDMAFHRPELPAALPAAQLASELADGVAADLAGLPSPLGVERPLSPPSAFRRWPLDEPAVRQLFDVDERYFQYDPWCYFRRQPLANLRRPWEEHPQGMFMMRTNSLGLRMDGEPRAERPDLRVLVAGDSHVDGVCFNREGFPALLEAGLAAGQPESSVEVLNTGCGGYTFHHYLGVLERFLTLAPDVFVVTVYGGNDFYEVLPLHHRFAGTALPRGGDAYPEQLARAKDASTAGLSQVFLTPKYFIEFPAEAEEALQAARDVTTEIQVTCLRHGVRPLFVYLPPAASVEWDVHAAPLEAVMAALELRREDMGEVERIADAYLAFLRERGLDAIDLRPVFERESEPLYWKRDHHLNVRGQAVVAEALLPLVQSLCPAGEQRVRPSPSALDPRSYALGATLLSPGAPGTAAPAEREAPGQPATPGPEIETVAGERVTLPPFVHRPLAAGVAVELFPPSDYRRYDPLTYVELRPDLRAERPHPGGGTHALRTNGLGMRSDSEVLARQPDLRVLIAGDELVDGPFANERSLGAQLEASLAERFPDLLAEALDAGCTGHSFANYLGVLQKHRRLRPDLFVMVVNAADDFDQLLWVQGRLDGAALPAADPALRLAEAATLAIQRTCLEAGTRLAVVYVPAGAGPELRGAREVGKAYRSEMRRAGVPVFEVPSPGDPGEAAAVLAEVAERWFGLGGE